MNLDHFRAKQYTEHSLITRVFQVEFLSVDIHQLPNPCLYHLQKNLASALPDIADLEPVFEFKNNDSKFGIFPYHNKYLSKF